MTPFLKDQLKAGFLRPGNGSVIRDLCSSNKRPALEIQNKAMVTLLDSVIQGDATTPGNRNAGHHNARNIQFENSDVSIDDQSADSQVSEKTISEYASFEDALSPFSSTGTTLKFPIEDVPLVPWDAGDNSAQWVNVVEHSADPDQPDEDTEAIQNAINAAREKRRAQPISPKEPCLQKSCTIATRFPAARHSSGTTARAMKSKGRRASGCIWGIPRGAHPPIHFSKIPKKVSDLYFLH